jgi:DNA polymerase-3 subunit alpha
VRDVIEEGRAVLVTADARIEGETLRLTAHEVEPLDKAASGAVAGMRVYLDSVTALPDIRALLERDGHGKGRVSLVPYLGPGREIEVTVPGGWNVSPRLMQALKILPGVGTIEEI